MGGADAEVVHASAATQCHAAFGIESVIAQPVVVLGAGAGWEGFGGVAVGLSGRLAVQGAVGAAFVVMGCERGQLGLESIRSAAQRVARRPAVEGLVEAFDLAWVWGWPGDPFFWRIPRTRNRYSKALRPPVNREV